jgi:hypothetical protein
VAVTAPVFLMKGNEHVYIRNLKKTRVMRRGSVETKNAAKIIGEALLVVSCDRKEGDR